MSCWLAAQEEQATISSNSQLIIATGSGHYIYAEQPHVVLDAIRDVLDAIRER